MSMSFPGQCISAGLGSLHPAWTTLSSKQQSQHLLFLLDGIYSQKQIARAKNLVCMTPFGTSVTHISPFTNVTHTFCSTSVPPPHKKFNGTISNSLDWSRPILNLWHFPLDVFCIPQSEAPTQPWLLRDRVGILSLLRPARHDQATSHDKVSRWIADYLWISYRASRSSL